MSTATHSHDLCLGVDYTRIMFGEQACRVPAWCYVQHQGDGIVSFIGSSKVPGVNPLRYGSSRCHQFLVGELIVRPRLVVASDALTGEGLSGLLTSAHDVDRMLSDGEVLHVTRGGNG